MLSCGVLVTDGRRLLIGHATRSPRWDIPKGQAGPGEHPAAAARRELEEETGLRAPEDGLAGLGQHRYLPRKELALFAWLVGVMPDPAALSCSSTFDVRGQPLPEFDGFACPAWVDALPRLGKSMRALLEPVALRQRWM